MIVQSSSVSLPGFVSTSSGMRTFPRSCSSPATPKPRTSFGPSPMNSASAIASTLTFSECVVVYWSNSFSCRSGMTMSRSPCMATDSDRTTLSASSSGNSPLIEAESVVRSLSVAMHGDRDIVIPLLQLKEFDQYTTTHSLNVSVLAMALAEFIGLGPKDVRGFGVAGLLHDLGKVRIPKDVLTKPGKLTDEDWTIMRRHPGDGARIIYESDRQLALASAVAYEHHIMINGGGYPARHFRRDCHKASRLVHICDVYDALRTNRPYREAWESERVLELLEKGVGWDYDAEIGRAFIQMMGQWELSLIHI